MSRKLCSLMILPLLISSCVHIPSDAQLCHYRNSIRAKSAEKPIAGNFSELAQLKNRDFDLCNAVLFVSKQMDPQTDIQSNLDYLNELSAELAYRLEGKTDYRAKVVTLNNFIWDKGFFCPNPFWKDYNPAKFEKLWYIDCSSFTDFLKSKQGNCLTMSLLYLILADKTGLPLYGSAIPGHLFVRYDDGVNRLNIETTAKGLNFTDQDYIDSYGDDLAKLRTYYLTNLTREQSFGCFMLNSGSRYFFRNNMKRSLFYFMVGNNFNPEDPALINGMAEVYFLTGDYDNAQSAFSKVLNINPYNPEPYCKMGMIYLKKGNSGIARSFFHKSTREKHHNLNEFFHKGLSYYCLGNYDKAIQYFSQINEQYPSHYDNLYFISCIQSIKGNKKKAIDYLQKAISINPQLKRRAQSEGAFLNIRNEPGFIDLIT